MALNIFAARYAAFDALERPVFCRPIVYIASFTFALYLGHVPLLNFFVFSLSHDPHSPGTW